MFNIETRIIPHSKQRYPTVGDWWFTKERINGKVIYETLHIRVSKMGNENYEFLVAQHEITEAMLCRARGISEEDVTKFDIVFEEKRKEHKAEDNYESEYVGEPGDHRDAPYRKEHFFATTQERAMAAELGVNWQEYDSVVDTL